MTPDAELRMEVYQEGQRAFGVGGICPYTDWRAGTWWKGYTAAKEWHATRAAEHRLPPTDEAERRIWAVFGLTCEDSVNGRWVGSIFSDGLQLDGNFTLEELEKVVSAWKGAT